jgi:hypothetical protein
MAGSKVVNVSIRRPHVECDGKRLWDDKVKIILVDHQIDAQQTMLLARRNRDPLRPKRLLTEKLHSRPSRPPANLSSTKLD